MRCSVNRNTLSTTKFEEKLAQQTGQRAVALCGEVYTHIKDDHAQR